MKSKNEINFSNATITKEDDGDYIITELSKDDTKVYNLNQRLDDFLNIEGISLRLAKTEEIPSEE